MRDRQKAEPFVDWQQHQRVLERVKEHVRETTTRVIPRTFQNLLNSESLRQQRGDGLTLDLRALASKKGYKFVVDNYERKTSSEDVVATFPLGRGTRGYIWDHYAVMSAAVDMKFAWDSLVQEINAEQEELVELRYKVQDLETLNAKLLKQNILLQEQNDQLTGPDTGWGPEHESYRYKLLNPAVEQMGGWANFRHWVLRHSKEYFSTCSNLEKKVRELEKEIKELKKVPSRE